MDIDLLSKMVKELILDNDRVVLPGLGSFVAEVVPSTFSDKGYTINPPYRRLFFRSKPDEGSELVSFYASSNQVEHDLAERIIKDFVAELKTILHSKKVVVFPGLGRLRATKENAVFFVADEDLDIYPAGFGLEPISLKTHQETREEVSAAVAGLKSLLEETVQEVPESAPEPIVEPEPAPAVPEPVPAETGRACPHLRSSSAAGTEYPPYPVRAHRCPHEALRQGRNVPAPKWRHCCRCRW
jgi:nucleoid DNA-binding protein